jgi:CRISPR-associated protein Cas5d
MMRNYGVRLHCWGDYALFTRPEMKVERVSYDVITPSAARGILEAIYWKPEIRWVIDRLHVLNPIRLTSQRRNEVGCKIRTRGPDRAEQAMKKGRGRLGIYVETERQQRAAMLLRDVAYVIEAHFDIVDGEPNEAKHLDQFNRRARAGQCFTRPYLGTRECAADFALIEHGQPLPQPHPSLAGRRELGWMLHDIDFRNGRQPFFHAVMVDGVIDVPSFDSPEVKR